MKSYVLLGVGDTRTTALPAQKTPSTHPTFCIPYTGGSYRSQLASVGVGPLVETATEHLARIFLPFAETTTQKRRISNQLKRKSRVIPWATAYTSQLAPLLNICVDEIPAPRSSLTAVRMVIGGILTHRKRPHSVTCKFIIERQQGVEGLCVSSINAALASSSTAHVESLELGSAEERAPPQSPG